LLVVRRKSSARHQGKGCTGRDAPQSPRDVNGVAVEACGKQHPLTAHRSHRAAMLHKINDVELWQRCGRIGRTGSNSSFMVAELHARLFFESLSKLGRRHTNVAENAAKSTGLERPIAMCWNRGALVVAREKVVAAAHAN
jgi:hypothetical protein